MPEATLGMTTEIVGMKWVITRSSLSREAAHRVLRREILYQQRSAGCKWDENGNMSMTFTMPCGKVIHFNDIDEIPMADVPCSCGDPTHWFVKYNYNENWTL